MLRRFSSISVKCAEHLSVTSRWPLERASLPPMVEPLPHAVQMAELFRQSPSAHVIYREKNST